MEFFHVCRLLFCIVNNIFAVPMYLACYLMLQPLKIISPSLFWSVEGWLYEKLLCMAGFWGQISGHRVFMSGDDITSVVNDESVFLSNHQSTADVPLIMYTLRGIRPSLRHVMWIMDWILQFTDFGWVAKGHRDCFILQGSDIRKYSFLLRGTEDEIKIKQATTFKEHLINVYQRLDRKWIILFPEGGFLYKRRAGSQRYCQRQKLGLLHHVALPRTGALKTIFEMIGVDKTKSVCRSTREIFAMKSHSNRQSKRIKWIIDATIGYPDGKPLNLLSWITGNTGSKDIFIHFKVHRASEALMHDAGDTDTVSDQWLYERFFEKEKLLENFYSTGKFPLGKLGIKKVKCFTFDTIIGYIFCLFPYIVIAMVIFSY